MNMNVKTMTAAAKKIDKTSDRLFINRIEDQYYICNGYYIVRVNDALYNACFRPASPVYIELQPGEGARRENKNPMPEKAEPLKILDIIPKEPGSPLSDTGLRASGKNNMHYFHSSDFGLIAFNHDYITMLEPFTVDGLNAVGPITPAIDNGIKDLEAPCGVVILPVRIAPDSMKYTIISQEENGKTASREAIKEARKEAEKIKEEARKEAEKIVSEARGKAEKALEMAGEGARVILEAAEEAAEPKEEPEAKPYYMLNNEHNGIEIYFNTMPKSKIRNHLKVNGYRWHNVKKCWYNKQSEKALQVAEELTR